MSPRTRRERFNQNKGRESAASGAPAPVSSSVSIQHGRQEESRIEQVPAAAPEPPSERAARWHHDVTRDPDVRRTIIEAGHDPDELTGEISVWAEAQSEPPVRPWVAFTQRWIALKPRFDGRRGSASKPARRPQDVAAERMLRDAAAAGFQGFGSSMGDAMTPVGKAMGRVVQIRPAGKETRPPSRHTSRLHCPPCLRR